MPQLSGGKMLKHTREGDGKPQIVMQESVETRASENETAAIARLVTLVPFGKGVYNFPLTRNQHKFS